MVNLCTNSLSNATANVAHDDVCNGINECYITTLKFSCDHHIYNKYVV